MDPERTSSSEIELAIRRERIRRGLTRANTAALLALLIVVALSLAAIRQAFQAEDNAREASLAQRNAELQTEQARAADARALLQQARAHRRTGEVGQRFGSIAAASAAAAVSPSTELRHEVIAALALPDVSFVPVCTNDSPNQVAQFSPNFDWLAIGAAGGRIEMIRIGDGKDASQRDARYLLPSAGPFVTKLWFSPDQHFLAGQYYDRPIEIWDLSKRQILRTLTSGQNFGAFAADSCRLLVVDASRIVRCLDLSSGRELWHYQGDPASADFLIQPQGKYFATTGNGDAKVQLRKMETGDFVCEIAQPRAVAAWAWSPDGNTIAIGREGGWLDTWEVESWAQISKWKAHDDAVVNLCFEPGGRRLASSSWDDTARFWTVPGYQREFSASGYQGQDLGKFSPDGRRYGCLHDGEVIGFLQLTESPVVRRIYVPPGDTRGAWSMDVSPDGKLLAAGYEDGFMLLDFTTGRRLEWKSRLDCRSVLFTRDGLGLLSCGKPGLSYWPLERSAADPASIHIGERRAICEGTHFVHAALSTDGQWVTAANQGASLLETFNLYNPADRFAFTNHPRIQFVALSSNGRWAATGTWKGIGVRIWDMTLRKFVAELPVNSSATVTFSPDNQFLATGSRRYQVWSCGSWQKHYSHPGTADAPPAAFSPDSRILAVLKNSHVIDMLEAATGRLLVTLEAPGSVPIWNLQFTPDGASLLALEGERQIQVWDLKNVRSELARLGLDWDANGNAIAGASSPVKLTPSEEKDKHLAVATPGSAFYVLALAGVLFSLLIGIYILRYNFRMIHSYEEAQSLVTQGNEQLKSARLELLHSQKMRALGTLAAGIAHDFNNLLSVIRMSNKLVDRKARDHSGIEEHVSDIEQAVLQGKSLVGSMLGYARNETGSSGPIDVNAVVENAVSLWSTEFLTGIALTLELDRNAPKVNLGNSRMEQILLNLLVNASEAMEGKGALIIRLQTRSSLPSRPYVLRPQPAEEFLELTVIDSGPGIAPEIKDRLFEPFFTTKNSRSTPGTGLGLSLVYSIAQEDGLGLSVDNAPKRGAAFSIVIPVHPVAPVRDRHSSQIAIKA
jgi:signal transduction histidine kinase